MIESDQTTPKVNEQRPVADQLIRPYVQDDGRQTQAINGTKQTETNFVDIDNDTALASQIPPNQASEYSLGSPKKKSSSQIENDLDRQILTPATGEPKQFDLFSNCNIDAGQRDYPAPESIEDNESFVKEQDKLPPLISTCQKKPTTMTLQ